MSTSASAVRSSRHAVEQVSIGQYLIQRLRDYGIRHVFGIPGDYVLSFYAMLEQSPLQTVGCTREDNAGFAADAYARVAGMGAVCITYCVGGLSTCNSVAGAFAEKSPVVVISGSPGLAERRNNPLMHHMVRDFRTQYEVYQRLCIAGAELNDPTTARREIDRVLDTVYRYKRPGYLELPRDMVHVPCLPGAGYVPPFQESDPNTLAEAVDEAVQMINQARRVVIVAGVELHRFGLQDAALQLVEESGIPFTVTMLGKGVIRETHPLYVGLYAGALGRKEVTQFVEESDCVILLGTFMSDINLGIYTANLDPGRCIYATSERLQIRHHVYPNVQLEDFLRELIARHPTPPPREVPPWARCDQEPIRLEPQRPITITRLIRRLNELIDEHTVVIADVGDAMFASTELVIRQRTEFLAPAYYTSMGFAIPAALGAKMANPRLRPLVLVGDGAFQMTFQELSTIIRHGQNPVVLVLNNCGYGTERLLHPGDWKFNEVQPWQYHKVPEIFGGGVGHEACTEGELDAALRRAWEEKDQMHLIHVHLDRCDCSNTLSRLAERLQERVGSH